MAAGIDSYEYYLMFHENKSEFMSFISSENKEIHVAILKLLQNQKLNKTDVENVFNKTIEMILNDKDSNFTLDEILEQSINSKLLIMETRNLLQRECDIQLLRVLNKFVNFALLELQSHEGFLKETSDILVNDMFREGPAHSFIVSLLKIIILNGDKKIGNQILQSIYLRCLERNDRLGLLNLCYFFDKMCDNSIFTANVRHLIKYFDSNNPTSCKQGVFLIKILIEKKRLKDGEANWKAFTIIMESLEESSHLSLPTLELLERIDISKDFEEFWFIICKQILEHQASLVRNWGLNYIMNIDHQFKSEQINVILNSLNFTTLFDAQQEQLVCSLKSFINRNFAAIFHALAEVNWLTLPFYYVLNEIKDHIEATRPIFTKDQLKDLQTQTTILPKKIKNVTFRPTIQKIYADILALIMNSDNLADFIQILINVHDINDNSECLDSCFHFVRNEDYDLIFHDGVPYKFLKYALVRLHVDRNLKEIRNSARNVKHHKKIIMEAICELNVFADGFEEYPDELIHETIDDMWANITEKQFENLKSNIDILEIGLNASKNDIEPGRIDQLIEMLSKIEGKEIYERILSIILRYRKRCDVTFLKEVDKSRKNLTTLFIDLKMSLDYENHSQIFYINLMNEMESMLDKISNEEEYLKIFELIEMTANLKNSMLIDNSFKDKFLNLFIQFVTAYNNQLTISTEFWTEMITILFKIVENVDFTSDWIISIEDTFERIFTSFSPPEKSKILLAILKMAKTTEYMNATNQLTDYFKRCLAEKVFEIDMMTKDHQHELELMNEIDKSTNEKLRFRLEAAKYLHERFNEKFTIMIRDKIVELSKISRKKPRYYSNSNIHRMKLHHNQTLLFCENIDKDVMDELIFELLSINNQLNIQYLLEIIVSRHHENFLAILNDEKLKADLKPQALKSIFSIAIMQIKSQMNFEIAERMLNEIYHKVFPYSMGQNFGVRVYSLLAIVLSFEHVKSLKNFKQSLTLSKIEELCGVINESVKQKNSLKYFNALKQDFRFVTPLNELLSLKFFYQLIPAATNMTFDELITVDGKYNEKIIVADLQKVSEQTVINDEIEMTIETQSKDGSVNLQQKYVPFKYQIPGDNLISSMPNGFRFYDVEQKSQNYELIVVASLVDRMANLGGLARTCEIFGASNYVIDSLKSIENTEFKGLSKTAEKWIKISEVKQWQLFDYLIAMKQQGYKIVGAEQSVNSVSLLNVEFPRKCVLLLGNESLGVPAELLSLMDVIIEIPQCGLIRSLNVHVTGAILIWEYAKKFCMK